MLKVLHTFCNSVEGKNRNRANILIERSNNAGVLERMKETGVLLEKRKFNRFFARLAGLPKNLHSKGSRKQLNAEVFT